MLKKASKAKHADKLCTAEVGLRKMLANQTHCCWLWQLLLLQARTLMFPD
jgi:hypothetical protein